MGKEYKDKKFEEDFRTLRDEVLILRQLVGLYKAIFNTENERIINEFRNFFRIIQISITESVILRIARLMDPYKQGSYKNLTLEILIKTYFYKIQNDSEKIDECEKSFKAINDKYENSIKKLRNKRIAHFDYKKGLGIFKEIKIIWKEIEEILEEIEKIIALFQEDFDFRQVSFTILKEIKEKEMDYLFGFILANKQVLEELDDLRKGLLKEDKEVILNSITETLYRCSGKPSKHIRHLREFLLDESYMNNSL